MKLIITYTERFKRHYKRLTSAEKNQLRKKLAIFSENPVHPSLRVHKIQGTEALWEFSVNMDIRVLWFYEGDELVALLDIGHHDILNRY